MRDGREGGLGETRTKGEKGHRGRTKREAKKKGTEKKRGDIFPEDKKKTVMKSVYIIHHHFTKNNPTQMRNG